MFNREIEQTPVNPFFIQKTKTKGLSQFEVKIPKNLINCKQKNEVYQFCMNKKCKQFAFTCSDLKCQCYKIHEKCQKGGIQFVLKTLKKKTDSTTNIKNIVNLAIDRQIQKLSNLRQEINELIDQKKNIIQLNTIQRMFYQVFYHNQKPQNLIGQDMVSVWNGVDQIQNLPDQLLIFFQYQMEKIGEIIISTIDQVNSQIHEKIDKIVTKNSFCQKNLLRYHKSSIINNEKQCENIKKLIPNAINISDVLFKGSQNRFNFNQCIKKCKQYENLLVLCQTQQNKVIGAFYTRHTLGGLFSQIKYKLSFVFSLTSNQKIKVKLKQRNSLFEICQSDSYDIGANYFSISQKANNNKQSFLYIDEDGYDEKLLLKQVVRDFNPKSIGLKPMIPIQSPFKKMFSVQNKKKLNIKYNGNQTDNFMVKQWQIISVAL